ncbi:unnamed protein product [Mytilus coruscus]|uniref:Uncharacterized protein n=1 Tax=Mytilus coruscus TaxID=42192 RepID=A0A6J8DZ51_MYTCO|nr:unnamed protein product [Mytilus coruscus]
MSDYFSPLNDLKFKDNIKLAKNPVFTNKSAVNETEVAISILFTYRFLKQLNDTADKYCFSYVEILNSQIDFVQFIDSERLNKRLRFLSYKVLAEIGSVKGRQRVNLLSKCTVVSIFKSELLDVRCYDIKLSKLDEKLELEKKCRVLSEKLSNENEMASIISEQNLDIYALQEKNSYLANYIQKLETQLPNVQTERDIDIDTLQPKTRQRTLKKLET